MRRKREPKHQGRYGALIPHTGRKGFKLIYQSNHLKLSLEIIANVVKYREFWKMKDGRWVFARSKWWHNPYNEDCKAFFNEIREKVEQDAKKRTEILE